MTLSSIKDKFILNIKSEISYLREAWQRNNFDFEKEEMTVVYKADNSYASIKLPPDKFEKAVQLNERGRTGWRPSIHMPKEAARIFLRVTGVRVERLQEIDKHWDSYDKEGVRNPKFENISIAMQEKFISIWNSTIKPADLEQYGWGANPWVWVIEFERIEKP